ncbi:FAD-dependent oxidoreductase [Christensenellaceae bacterium OttesenSCG-928-M15]|nr:FAD-dependent oxidoreductase [Christensenellaceae bacterium OttesenSCG-928-M15]
MIKKLTAAGMALCMIFMFGCAQPAATPQEDVVAAPTSAPIPTDAAPAGAINGTFEGSGYGMQGPISVQVEVVNSAISNVTLLENKETPEVAVVAIERIPRQIVEHQSLGIDAVTGATLTSNGILNAVADALKSAGLDVDALRANKIAAQPGPDEVWDADVLVMGGGGAGFSAAIAAAQEGANVILIEKSSVLGGNTMMAGSAFNAVDKEAQSLITLTKAQKDTLDGYLALNESDEALKFDIFPQWAEVLATLKKDINDHYAANKGKTAGEDMPSFDSVALHMWHIYTGGLRQLENGEWIASDIDLARNLAESALDTFAWMNDIGLEPVYGAAAKDNIYTVLGAMWPRTHEFMRASARITTMAEKAASMGITIYTETAGSELLVQDGKVVGARAKKADGTNITINTTNGVVIATGGYCANPAMVKEYDQYWGENLSATTLSTNLGTNKGDGIVMAQSIGAQLTGMEIAQMMPSSSPTKGTLTDGSWGSASEQIWIDGAGNRFVNEYAERDVLAKASLALDNGVFYILYAGSNPGDPTAPLQGTRRDEQTYFGGSIGELTDGGQIWYGETLAELAEATKTAAAGQAPAFTEEALRATIEQYNAYVAAQSDPDFGKEVLAGAIDLAYIDATDNAGIAITPRRSSLHHTMGGIVIDTDAHVINQGGEIISGLWAAGEVTGGIHAGNRLGGNAITDIFTYGRIAGTNAATNK